jgi:mannosyltransferase OCH1-like enzyme
MVYPSTTESFSESIIPLKIFQTWNTKELPIHMKKNCILLQKQNPQFEYFLYDDEDCLQFIKNHFGTEVVEAYNRIIPGAYKADLWRYCILYVHGGIYLDMKMRCVGDFRLIELTKKEHYVKDRYNSGFVKGSFGIYNAVMIQRPKNPLMLDCINQIIENVKNLEYGFSCLYPTGPGLLGDMYNEKRYKYRLSELDMFHDLERETIRYKNRVVLEHYPEYRKEQLNNQIELHYAVLWNKNSIYLL